MSGLIGGLINAAKSLTAQQAGVQVAGRNLANVNNPEYARQRVMLGDRVVMDSRLGPVGSGVEVLGIKQIRDQFLDIAVTRETSQTASLQAQQSALERAQANLGEQVDRAADSAFIGDATHSTNGISAALNDFFNAFDNLAANPTDAGAKQVLLQKADILANKFNVTDARLGTLQSDLTAEVGAGVSSVNSLLKQIADLNGGIAQFEIGAPGSAVDLRDQRQARLEELAGYMDFSARSIPGSNGQIQIVAKDAGGADVLLVDKTAVLGGVNFDGYSSAAAHRPRRSVCKAARSKANWSRAMARFSSSATISSARPTRSPPRSTPRMRRPARIFSKRHPPRACWPSIRRSISAR